MNLPQSKPALVRVLRIAAALALTCLMLAPRANADPIGPQALVQRSVMVSGNLSSVYAFEVKSAGVLVVRLENIAWPERLAVLDCSIFSETGFVEALSGGTEFRYSASGPGWYFANVLAGAAGSMRLGLYSIKISFESAGALVPLPAAGWLLASVLGMLGFRRHALPALKFAFSRHRFA